MSFRAIWGLIVVAATLVAFLVLKFAYHY